MNQLVDIGILRCGHQAFFVSLFYRFKPQRMVVVRVFVYPGLNLAHIFNMGHYGIRTVADGLIALSFPGYELEKVRIDIMEALIGRAPAFNKTVFDTSELIIMLEYSAFFTALEKHGKALFIRTGTLIRVSQTSGYG